MRRFLVAVFLLGLFAAGFWTLNQTLDAVVVLNRAFVDVPLYPAQVDVWSYHDVSFSFLWVSYVGLVLWELTPWRPGNLKLAGVAAALLGFTILTAGLWLAQDIMNAAILSHRAYVDLPFFVERLDLLAIRDFVLLLTTGGFLLFYVMTRVTVTKR